MSSELLGAAQNVLKGNLGGAWDINKGYADAYTDLGIGRRFGGATMAFSLRDIGAMNGRVVKARRDVDGQGSDPEEDFSAKQVSSGTLEDWVNGKLEGTLPADVATAAAAYSLRKVKASYSGNAVRIRRSSDDIEVDVAFDSDGKVSASSAIINVAEQGGESGQTTDTTLGDFISGTDAFVHTWYDQAGSNDATQATDANQPKIADSGALLADGIDFDGSNDLLGLTSALGATTTQSIFVVQKNDITTGGTLLFDNRDANDDGSAIFATDTAGKKQASWDAADAEHTATTNEELISLIKTTSAIKIIANAVEKGSTASTSTIDISNAPKIGASFSSGNHYDGSIKELICYNSDQSNNRFKIESNINNYYGLYNDANELTQTEWQNTGGESFSSTSTDGFSFSNSSSTAFIGVTLSETLALNDSVFISFNASGVTHPASSDQSPQVRLRDSVSGGSGTSPINQVTNGFNAYELEYTTGSSGQHIVFSEGDTAGGTVTISDFKVSRVARNGLVETWYDQSGNGFDLKSQSADTQPFIVNNGGFTGGVYSPSRLNNSTKQYLEISDPDFDSTNITSSKFGWLAVMANMEENDGSDAGGVILGNTRNTQSFPAGSISLTLSDTNPNGRMFVTNLKTSSTGDFIGAVDNDNLFTSETIGTAIVSGSALSTFLNGTTGSGTFTDLTLTSNVHFKIFQASDAGNNPYYQNAAQGFIKELMFMQGDTIDDIVTIRNEVNNHYNIF